MVAQSQRREKTRETLLQTARQYFIERGYEQTTTAEILSQSGVSKGGMYHHFSSKLALMEAIYTNECETVIAKLRQERHPTSPLETLIKSIYQWLQMMQGSDTGTIMLEQGPKALGWKTCRIIETQYSLQPMMALIGQAVENKEIAPTSPRYLAQMINAMITEVAMIQRHEKPSAADELEVMVAKMIRGLTQG